MRRLLVLLILLFLPVCVCAEQIVSTSEWVPPVLDDVSEDQPWLYVLKVAQEELGYQEPAKNQSKYGEWFGEKTAAWCSEFVSWCAAEADNQYGTSLSQTVYPKDRISTTMAKHYISAGRFISDTGKLQSGAKQWLLATGAYISEHSYLPYPGDVVWFCYKERGKCDHTALVEGVSDDGDGTYTLHVIEGNNPDSVARNTYPLEKGSIYGFGTPVKRAWTDMKRYSKGEDVAAVQQMLITLGYYSAEKGKSGEYTAKLQKAVKAFQGAHSLKQTGSIQIQTLQCLLEQTK